MTDKTERDPSDQELARQFREEGNEAAFEELWTRYANWARLIAYEKSRGQQAIADETVSFVFYDLRRVLGREPPEHMPALVKLIAQRRASDVVDREVRQTKDTLSADGFDDEPDRWTDDEDCGGVRDNLLFVDRGDWMVMDDGHGSGAPMYEGGRGSPRMDTSGHTHDLSDQLVADELTGSIELAIRNAPTQFQAALFAVFHGMPQREAARRHKVAVQSLNHHVVKIKDEIARLGHGATELPRDLWLAPDHLQRPLTSLYEQKSTCAEIAAQYGMNAEQREEMRQWAERFNNDASDPNSVISGIRARVKSRMRRPVDVDLTIFAVWRKARCEELGLEYEEMNKDHGVEAVLPFIHLSEGNDSDY